MITLRDAGGHLTVPFVPRLSPRKGVIHFPSEGPEKLNPASRDSLLKTIARSRAWIDVLRAGAIASLEEIAAAEGLAERYVRFLAPLAFVSPEVIALIAEADARANLRVSDLARRLPYSWAEQNRTIAIRDGDLD